MGGSKKDLVALPAAVVDVFGYGLYLSPHRNLTWN
jgi:hypothetical protein